MPRSLKLSLAYRPYRRPFARPLVAAWGIWPVREGILIRCRDARTGAGGYGEVAPLPAFGTEGVEQALAYLAHLAPGLTTSEWATAVEQAPPATAFGLWAAERNLDGAETPVSSARAAALLALDAAAPARVLSLHGKGVRTGKFKLGVLDRATEARLLSRVMAILPEDFRIRLDPNRSWSRADWAYWRPRLAGWGRRIEFVEEPFPAAMPPGELLETATSSPVPIALDESLAQRGSAFWLGLGWPGYWVVKPSLVGNPSTWLAQLAHHRERVVLSSAFETGIGLGALVRLADAFPGTDHGLGTQDGFDDHWKAPEEAGRLFPPSPAAQEALWNRLPGA